MVFSHLRSLLCRTSQNHSPIGGHSDDQQLITISKQNKKSLFFGQNKKSLFFGQNKKSWYLERWKLDTHLTQTTKSVIPSSGKEHESFIILCSCNGLVILEHSYDENLIRKYELIMWNPSTSNDYSIILFPSETRDFYSVYGFGYDKSNNDYKLVKFDCIVRQSNGLWSYTIQVYSSKRNCWGNCLGKSLVTEFSHFANANTVVDDRMIFPCNDTLEGVKKQTLVQFDICSEEWLDHHLSTPELPAEIRIQTVGVLDNCLCINTFFHLNKSPADVWVMKEYGVKESWIKLLCLSSNDPLLGAPPIFYSKGRDKVLLKTWYFHRRFHIRRLEFAYCWYNLKDKTINDARHCQINSNMFRCVASLVQVPGSKTKNKLTMMIQECRKDEENVGREALWKACYKILS